MDYCKSSTQTTLRTLSVGVELYFASKQVIFIFGTSGFPTIYILKYSS